MAERGSLRLRQVLYSEYNALLVTTFTTDTAIYGEYSFGDDD